MHASIMSFCLAQGHGFRKDLVNMLADLKPQFIRFPGKSALSLSVCECVTQVLFDMVIFNELIN